MKLNVIILLVVTMIAMTASVHSVLADTTAEQELQTLVQDIPEDWWEGGWDKQEELEAFITKYSAETELCAKAQYYIGGFYYSKKEYNKAIEAYKDVARWFPEAPYAADAQFEIGQLYLNTMNDPAQAVEYYKKVISSSPTAHLTHVAQLMLGRAYKQMGDIKNATAAYNTLLTNYPLAKRQHVEALIDLGDIALDNNNAREALLYYKQAFLGLPAGELDLLQKVLDRIYYGFKNLDLSIVRANQFMKFQKYGPNGEDGIPNTKDDLTNPLVEL